MERVVASSSREGGIPLSKAGGDKGGDQAPVIGRLCGPFDSEDSTMMLCLSVGHESGEDIEMESLFFVFRVTSPVHL